MKLYFKISLVLILFFNIYFLSCGSSVGGLGGSYEPIAKKKVEKEGAHILKAIYKYHSSHNAYPKDLKKLIPKYTKLNYNILYHWDYYIDERDEAEFKFSLDYRFGRQASVGYDDYYNKDRRFNKIWTISYGEGHLYGPIGPTSLY
jgi:hypothetical protein